MPAAPPPHIRVLPHVRRAIDAGEPVVALESSVLAQGLPTPHNADAARRMVSAVERAGAIAAITAVVCGQPSLGLEPAELERFLRRDGIRKVSARDIAIASVQQADGATTVAGAIAIASLGGVRVLATGGIGGVHRVVDADARVQARDESADLRELATHPMVVVCSGAKSILDLAATWERLDTLGIPVVGYRTDELPGFFTGQTGIQLTARADTAQQIARIAAAHFALARNESILVVQPPPHSVALDAELIERAVTAALREAGAKGIRGPGVTPYLLDAVSRETNGKTLATNLALLDANAGLAGEIAAHLASGAPKPASRS